MHVLVSGGTGVVGQATVNALLSAGHRVRLLSRHAAEDARRWADGVESFPADIGDPPALRGAADGCDAVLHVAGIVREAPPAVTFERINVEGTRHLVDEAARAGVPRFVYVSTLGADRGTSDYQQSKRAGEEIVAGFVGNWTIVRPGNVYGPGDEVISLLLRMVRTLPAVPVIGSGDQPFQPIWHEDVGEALARCVMREDLAGRILEIAGPDVTTPNEVLDAFARITERSPLRVPVPEFLARFAVGAAEMLGAGAPVNADQITMLIEENVLRSPDGNALTEVFDVEPTSLEIGLARLADDQPEQTPDEGVGTLVRRIFWVDIRGSTRSAAEMCGDLRARFGDFVPIETAAEPGTPEELTEGAALTLALPARGNIQVRVEEVTAQSVTLATLAGHPLAGTVTFRFEERGDVLRFMIDVVDRPASRLDQLAMALFGARMQEATWLQACERVAEESGGSAPEGAQHRDVELDDIEAAAAEELIDSKINRRRQKQDNAV